MQTKIIMQKNGENTLAKSITASFERKPKKVYFFCGNLKETGFRVIEDGLIDSKIKSFFAIGIDKKNTTRGMLEDILKCTKDVFFFSNNGMIEFNANINIFEYQDEAVVYTSASNVSQSGLEEDASIYVEIIYDLTVAKEKEQYKNQLKDILKEFETETFQKLDKAKIEELVDQKEIFSTKQFNHNIKSISELLGNTDKNTFVNDKKGMSKQEIDDVYISDVSIPKVDLSDISIDFDDIDFSSVEDSDIKEVKVKENKKNDNVDIDYSDFNENTNNFSEIEQDDSNNDIISKDNELYDESLENVDFNENDTLDINDLLFSKADIKLDQPAKESKKEKVIEEDNDIPEEFKEEEIVQGKKVNLNNVTNLILELPSKTSKGQDMNSIKIPNYIKTMIPAFFEISEKGKNIEENGVKAKVRNINVEVVDVKSGSKYTDRNAKMIYKNGQSYMTFVTDTLKNITFEEDDIARVIKLSSDVYYIEIISKDMQEYKLWSKLCNQKLKSSTRRFGMM